MFNYCPNCSTATTGSDNFPFRCQHCGFTYYHNTASAVAAIIVCDDEILLTQRAKEPGKGKWDLPGGFVDHNEKLEDALTRELKEELGIDVAENEMSYFCSEPNVYEYKGVTYQTCDAVFVVRVKEKMMLSKEKQEIMGFEWCKRENINLEDFAFDSLRKAVAMYLRQHC